MVVAVGFSGSGLVCHAATSHGYVPSPASPALPTQYLNPRAKYEVVDLR